jgi:hypothetical protein
MVLFPRFGSLPRTGAVIIGRKYLFQTKAQNTKHKGGEGSVAWLPTRSGQNTTLIEITEVSVLVKQMKEEETGM